MKWEIKHAFSMVPTLQGYYGSESSDFTEIDL